MALFLDRLAISSPDFGSHQPIPSRFSADGGNATPRIRFEGAPDGTVELALVVHDPDAPLPQGFTHWTVYGIPAGSAELDLAAEGVQVGPNSMARADWSGPQPPSGHGVHHYYFWVYALRRPVEGTPSREQFLVDSADAIIEQARLVGTYES